jgi:hypothetical protein
MGTRVPIENPSIRTRRRVGLGDEDEGNLVPTWIETEKISLYQVCGVRDGEPSPVPVPRIPTRKFILI